MEAKTPANDKYFIVIRGKSRKGFCRGCIGRVETETPHGEIMGLLYATGSPKNGGMVAREDTYPLNRHQAQLLLFVSNIGRRLELLCNPQLFSAICELALDDLVVVKHRKGHLPGVVRNLMQVGRKESKDDLHMLGFEVEFMVGTCILPSKYRHRFRKRARTYFVFNIVPVMLCRRILIAPCRPKNLLLCCSSALQTSFRWSPPTPPWDCTGETAGVRVSGEHQASAMLMCGT